MTIISMSIIYTLVFSLLWLLLLSKASVAAGRHLGVVHTVPENITTTQNPTKSDQMIRKDYNIDDISSKSTVTSPDERNAKTNGANKSTYTTSQEMRNVQKIVSKERRVHDHEKRHSKKSSKLHIKSSKFPKATVLWRVPKNRKGVPADTGFNLDYAPPRVHPPAHN